LVDSFIVTWALGTGWWFLGHFSKVPWHVPERTNFATTWYNSLLIYIMKCVPVVRGASRAEISLLIARLEYLLKIGEAVFLFPEATRSRTGRVQTDSPAHGVGRLINAVPECRILMVYLRGDHQETWGERPVRDESFYIDISFVELKSELRGMRRSQDFAQQTVNRLQQMEERYFASRGQ
jgi:1-acyl-sn-glycerol-3-phosphate acyltransferase